MRLIDADAFKMEDFRHCLDCDSILQVIKHSPTVDAVPVVRCKDCKHEEDCMKQMVFWVRDHVLEQNVYKYAKLDFCSYGERKENTDG